MQLEGFPFGFQFHLTDQGLHPQPLLLEFGQFGLARQLSLGLPKPNQQDADVNIQHEDACQKKACHKVHLEMLVGVVEDFAVEVQQISHCADPSLGDAEENLEAKQRRMRRHVDTLPHPVSSPVEAVLLGGKFGVDVVTIIALVLKGP